jgi:predicted transcriptional regulator
MNIVTRELLVGPAPTEGAKEFARYFLRLTRVEELDKRRMIAYYARSARTAGLSHREVGEILGHTEGWVRQFLKDTAGKTELWEFADAGFRGNGATLIQFYKDLALTSNMGHKLHLCAEYGLSDNAVADLLRLNPGSMKEVMADYRADAAA